MNLYDLLGKRTMRGELIFLMRVGKGTGSAMAIGALHKRLYTFVGNFLFKSRRKRAEQVLRERLVTHSLFENFSNYCPKLLGNYPKVYV